MLAQGVQMRIYGPSSEEPALEHAGDFIAVPSVSAPGRKEYRISLGFPKTAKTDCERFKPDLVHIATPDLLGAAALRWALKKELPVVSSFHTNFLSYFSYYWAVQPLKPVFAAYLRWFYRHCQHIYVPSPSMIEELSEQMDTKKTRLWARGVDLERFNPSNRDIQWRAAHGFGAEDIVITFVSRLVLEKDVDIYAKTLRLLIDKYPKGVKSLVVGEGPAKSEMQQWLPEAVFTGTLRGDELSTAYASSDLFLFPSISETFGNVTLEALASGLPSFVADAPGSKSLVTPALNGCIAKPKSPEDFARKMSPLIESEERRKTFSAEARKAAERYSWDEINHTLLHYYREAAKL